MPVVERALPEYIITPRGEPGTRFTRILVIKGSKIDAYREAAEYLRYRPNETVYYYHSMERHYVWTKEKQRDEGGKPERLGQKTL
jgi:hypothetical protein